MQTNEVRNRWFKVTYDTPRRWHKSHQGNVYIFTDSGSNAIAGAKARLQQSGITNVQHLHVVTGF